MKNSGRHNTSIKIKNELVVPDSRLYKITNSFIVRFQLILEKNIYNSCFRTVYKSNINIITLALYMLWKKLNFITNKNSETKYQEFVHNIYACKIAVDSL